MMHHTFLLRMRPRLRPWPNITRISRPPTLLDDLDECPIDLDLNMSPVEHDLGKDLSQAPRIPELKTKTGTNKTEARAKTNPETNISVLHYIIIGMTLQKSKLNELAIHLAAHVNKAAEGAMYVTEVRGRLLVARIRDDMVTKAKSYRRNR